MRTYCFQNHYFYDSRYRMPVLELCPHHKMTFYREILAECPKGMPENCNATIEFLKVAAQLSMRQDALFEKHGLTSGRFALLVLLRREDSRALPASELAKRSLISRATMTQFIDSLEKAGLVARTAAPADRRATLIKLTSRGETLLKSLLPQYLAQLSSVMGNVSRAEKKNLHGLLDKICTTMASLKD